MDLHNQPNSSSCLISTYFLVPFFKVFPISSPLKVTKPIKRNPEENSFQSKKVSFIHTNKSCGLQLNAQNHSLYSNKVIFFVAGQN
jgi:hypothetical protein